MKKTAFLIIIILSIGLVIGVNYYFRHYIGPMCTTHDCFSEAGAIEGINGKGFRFNNSNYIIVDNKSLDNLGYNDFNISLWFRLKENTIADLFFKGKSDSNWFAVTQRNSKYKKDGSGGFQNYGVWVQFDDGNYTYEARSIDSFNDDKWHFINVGFIRTKNGWRIYNYIDNKLQGSKELDNYGYLNNTEPIYLGSACGNTLIKANKHGCFEYYGDLDEIKIYDENNKILVELSFDNIDGNKIIDRSGNNNHGIIKIKE